MASGILGQSSPAATTLTSVYTVPANTLSILNITVVNRSTTTAGNIRIALSATGTPTDSEYIEYDANILPTGVLERTGIALDEGKRVVVYASSTDFSVSVYGLEQSTV